MWRTADRGGSQTEEARGGSQKINKEQAAPPHRWALPRLASGDHKLGGGGVVVTPQHCGATTSVANTLMVIAPC